MKNASAKDILVTVLFLAVLYAFFFINLFKPANALSLSERRKLAQFPAVTVDAVGDREWMDGFDRYATDQMAFRETFRRLKAVFDRNVLRKADNNGIFLIDKMIFKTEYPLKEKEVGYLCDRIDYIYEKYLQDGVEDGMKVCFSVVPDKNYYLGTESGYLVMDYRRLETLVRERLASRMDYLDLFDLLSLDCYYATDAHWRQEKIGEVAAAIGAGLGVDIGAAPVTEERYYPFYGVYYGQSALNIPPDELVYLVSPTTENAVVTTLEQPDTKWPVYDSAALGGMDSYNLFVAGPTALVTIQNLQNLQNPGNTSGRELIIFRDSYASSLAPLLLDGYQTITLVDLRYIHPDLVGDYIDFNRQDILFLYSATLFNNSGSIK